MGVVYDEPISDMSIALGMHEPSRSRVYQGWYDRSTSSLPFWPFRTDYQKWTQDEWKRLGDGEDLYTALLYAISHQTNFDDPNAPVNTYRLKGQGSLFDIELNGN